MRLLARVQAAAAAGGEPLVDLGRGNPDVPPPQHVIDALTASANEHDVARARLRAVRRPARAAARDRGALRGRATASSSIRSARSRSFPGTKSALVELVLCVAERGDTVLLPDPYYPDYPSGIALAGAELGLLQLDPERGYAPRFDLAPRDGVALVFLNYPSNPTAAAVKDGTFADAVAFARETGAAIVHDFAYGDLVFDGREPRSFLAEPGARDVGVELFSMSKSFGMAGWRLGFVVGNEELVARDDDAAGSRARGHLHAGSACRDRGAHRAAGIGRRARTAVRAETRTRPRRARRARGAVRGDVLRLAAPAGRPDARAPARGAPARRRAGRGLRPVGRGWARLSLATPDDVLDLGLERLGAASRVEPPGRAAGGSERSARPVSRPREEEHRAALLSRRPSPAIVISLVALFVALGGTVCRGTAAPQEQRRLDAGDQRLAAERSICHARRRRAQGQPGRRGPARAQGAAGAAGATGRRAGWCSRPGGRDGSSRRGRRHRGRQARPARRGLPTRPRRSPACTVTRPCARLRRWRRTSRPPTPHPTPGCTASRLPFTPEARWLAAANGSTRDLHARTVEIPARDGGLFSRRAPQRNAYMLQRRIGRDRDRR